jgi:hypothetical protein
MGYTRGGLGKNGHGIDSPIMPDMLTPRKGLGYDNVVASFPTLGLATTREVLFVLGGVQIDFPVDQSTEPMDAMVILDMPEYQTIFFYDIATNILDFSTPKSTPDLDHLSLDHPTLCLIIILTIEIGGMEIILSNLFKRNVKDIIVDQF